ncbi:hypothetical protein CCP4SC76_300005 [Gammaproteobacteria bacterium]
MKDFIIKILAKIIAWSVARKLKKIGINVDKNNTSLAFEKQIKKELFNPVVCKDKYLDEEKRRILLSKIKIVNANDRINVKEELFDYDGHGKRICIIFKSEEAPDVAAKTLNIYKAFLKKNIDRPCHITGIEDMGCFEWEERYVLGGFDKDEYRELKKTKPSYTDVYELIRLEDKVDRELGIIVRVKRLSDGKIFELPLADLKANNDKSKNYQLLRDYSVWFVNNNSY